MKDNCVLIERKYMYDVYLNGQYVGKGQRHYMNTAFYFYTQEGFKVEVLHG